MHHGITIFEEVQVRSQVLSKKSKVDYKNVFVEHVVLLEATLPETEQCLILRWRLSADVDLYTREDSRF